MIKTKFEPNEQQREVLQRHIEAVQFVYDMCIREQSKWYCTDCSFMTGMEVKDCVLDYSNQQIGKWLKDINTRVLDWVIALSVFEYTDCIYNHKSRANTKFSGFEVIIESDRDIDFVKSCIGEECSYGDMILCQSIQGGWYYSKTINWRTEV